MKQFWIVVLTCYICVNDNYLFTRAENLSSTIPLKLKDIQISCNDSLLLQIRNVTVPQNTRSCKNHTCVLNEKDTNDIKQRCDGANVCKPNLNLTSKCLVEQAIGTYEISYDCKVMCDFESDQCPDLDADNDGVMLYWNRTKVSTINGISKDHTTDSEHGFIMYAESNKLKARMKIPIVRYKHWTSEWICLNFWYISVGPKLNPLILYKNNYDVIERYNAPESKDVWTEVVKDVHITDSNHIIFEANFLNGKGALGLDDISISMNTCEESNTSVSTFEEDFGDWVVGSSQNVTWNRTHLIRDHTRVNSYITERTEKTYVRSSIKYDSIGIAAGVSGGVLLTVIVIVVIFRFRWSNSCDCVAKNITSFRRNGQESRNTETGVYESSNISSRLSDHAYDSLECANYYNMKHVPYSSTIECN